METIKVLPINEHGFTSYPLPEDGAGVIEISVEDYDAFTRGEAKFAPDLKTVIPCEKPAKIAPQIEENGAEIPAETEELPPPDTNS